MSEKVQTKVYLPPEIKAMMDADKRNNSEVVESALITEYGGEKKAAIERKIEEKERRITNLKSERNERNRKIEEVEQQLSGLENQLEATHDAKMQKVHEAIELFDHGPITENQAEHWADKADMTVERFTEVYNEERQ